MKIQLVNNEIKYLTLEDVFGDVLGDTFQKQLLKTGYSVKKYHLK